MSAYNSMYHDIHYSSKEVTSPHQRVFFDNNSSTFRLYCGNSLYAFCISADLALEHLYFGDVLHNAYDLRYLSGSTRKTVFQTTETVLSSIITDECDILSEDNTESASIIAKMRATKTADTLDQLKKIWDDTKNSNKIKHQRMKNMSWRLLSMNTLNQPSIFEDDATSDEAKREKLSPVERSASYTFGHVPKDMTGVISNRSTPRNRPSISPIDVSAAPHVIGSPTNTRSPLIPPPGKIHLTDEASFGPTLSIASVPTTPLATSRSSPILISGQSSAATSPKASPSFDKRRAQLFDRLNGQIGKEASLLEYADQGTGDFRNPSFKVIDSSNGSSISPLKYRRHLIKMGKDKLPDYLPSINVNDDTEATTLIITMGDAASGLEVDLVYVVLHGYDAILRRSIFRNVDKRATPDGKRYGKVIEKACSLTIDFETELSKYTLVKQCGNWARERYIVETVLTEGTNSFGSTRGITGHQFSSFAAVTVGAPSETSGEVKAFTLCYSGNFLYEFQLNETGRLRVNMGIHPDTFSWYLKQNTTFHTPEAIIVRSSEGLGGISRQFHQLFNDKLIPRCIWAETKPPILINTWEAAYFDVGHDQVVSLAKKAKKIGCDLVVIDDGWFGGRYSDTSSLGDWIVNEQKFPQGLSNVAKQLNDMGMKLGIWVEPEMLSEESELYRKHPNWCLRVPNRPYQVGRNQMVLDLSRWEVKNYILESLFNLLNSANIEYIKWDMNRPLCEVFSQRFYTCETLETMNSTDGAYHPYDEVSSSAIPPVEEPVCYGYVWQAETGHRYILGLYEILHRLREAFPEVLLEVCGSGGARCDAGMMFYSHQQWCSDNTDGIVRMKIQYGSSLLFPAKTIGAHVSICPNHITGNVTRARTRVLIAMCGTYGYELDPAFCSDEDLEVFQAGSELYRRIHPIIRYGLLYRLWSPFKSNLCAWMYVTKDKSAAVVFAFSVNSEHWSILVPRLYLQGLERDAEYEIIEPMPNNVYQCSSNLKIGISSSPLYQMGYKSVILTGEILLKAGLPIRFYTLDDSIVFTLKKISSATIVQKKN